MESIDQYRKYAEKCLDWAKTAKSDRECETFLDMVRLWLKAISQIEMATVKNESNQ
jgi:hypothetical protein